MKNSIDMLRDSTLQLALKKLSSAEIWYDCQEYTQLSTKPIKILFYILM